MFEQLKEIKKSIDSSVAGWDVKRSNAQAGRKKTGVNDIDKSLKMLMLPDSIVEKWDHTIVSGISHSVLGCAGYPAKIRSKWLNGLVDDDSDINFTQFISKIDNQLARDQAQKHLRDLETEVITTERGGNVPSEELRNKIAAIKNRIAKLGSGDEAAFNMALYLGQSDLKQPVLREKVAWLKSRLDGLMIIPAELSFKKTNAHKNFMPSGVDFVDMYKEFDSTSMAESILFPGRAVAGGLTADAIYIGVDFDTGVPIFYDKFDKSRNNYNCFTMGKSGSGKSFSESTRIIHEAWAGRSISIIDPKDDYSHIITKLGGIVVKVCEGAEGVRMNPFDIGNGPKDSLTARQQEIPKFLLMLLGPEGVTAAGLPIIDTAVNEIYKARGITSVRDTWDREPPILEDFYDYIENYLNFDDIDREEKQAGKALNRKLKMYVKGSYKNFFNGQTNIQMDEKYISYNLLEIPDTVQDAVMYQIMLKQFAFMINKSSGKRTLIVDEAWSLMQKESHSIKSLIKLCRYFDLCVELLTQDLGDISKTEVGDAILGNCETKFIFSVEYSERAKVKETFGLSDEQADFISSTRQKGEGLFISSGVVTKLKVIAAPNEKELIESKAEPMEPLCTKTDLQRLMYPMKDLLPEQKEILTDNGYKVVRSGKLGYGQASYIINKSGASNQSDEHFIFAHLIGDVAKNNDLDVQISDRGKNPDVLITNLEGKTLGFEVEMNTNNNSDLLEKVDRLNETKGLDSWYFVTHKKYTDKYEKYHNKTISFIDIEEFITNFATEKKNQLIVEK